MEIGIVNTELVPCRHLFLLLIIGDYTNHKLGVGPELIKISIGKGLKKALLVVQVVLL